MALTDSEADWLEHLLALATAPLGDPLLSRWERQFIADQEARFGSFEHDMFLSKRQWAVLRRIAADKLGMDVGPAGEGEV